MKLKIAILIALMSVPVVGKAVDPPVTADSSNNWLPALRNGFAPNLPAGSKMGGVLISTGTGLPSMTGNSGKYLTTDGSSASWATVPPPSDTAFASSWNGVTTIAPSKNAVYDIIHAFDTDDNGKVNVLDLAAGIPKTNSSGVLSLAVAGTDYVSPSGTLALAGFSSITGRIGNPNLPLGAQMFDNSGTPKLAADFGSRQLTSSDGLSVSVDWEAWQLSRNGALLLDWGSLQLFDLAGNTSLDWSSRLATDNSDQWSIDWQSRHLHSEALPGPDGPIVLDWQNSLLVVGGETALDWSNGSKIQFFTGASYVTNTGVFTGDGSGLTNLPAAVGDDTAYDATSWNGDAGVPTKNAVRDKIETLGTAAYTAATAYATSTQGTKADNAMPKAGGTFTGDILFTDALYDIGKSGATRPRDLFISRNAVIGGAITQTGKTTTYNNIATEGNGVAAIVKATRVTSQTAANSSIASYTTPALDGSYLVSGNINVIAAIAISTSLNVDYTDETNTARTMIIPISGLGGTFLAGGLATSTGPFESSVMHIRTKASTTIKIYTAAGTFTSATYNAEGVIRQIQ